MYLSVNTTARQLALVSIVRRTSEKSMAYDRRQWWNVIDCRQIRCGVELYL